MPCRKPGRRTVFITNIKPLQPAQAAIDGIRTPGCAPENHIAEHFQISIKPIVFSLLSSRRGLASPGFAGAEVK